MPCVSKAAFLKPLRQKTVQFPLPEYGEGSYVVLQALTAPELLDLQAKYGKEPSSDNAGFLYDVLCRSMVDDSGTPLFADAAECKAGVALSVPAMEALLKAALDVSGISHRSEEKN